MPKRRRIRKIEKKQSGGYLTGPSHEDGGIPAVTPGQPPIELEGGEYIINAATTAALGTEFLDKLNRTASPYHSQPGFNQGQLPGSDYKSGGIVGKMRHGGNTSRNNTSTPPREAFRTKQKGLPESFRMSDVSGKFCSNCLFFRNKFCKQWVANVEMKTICDVWVGSKITNIRKSRGRDEDL